MTTTLVIPRPKDYQSNITSDFTTTAIAWLETADDLDAVLDVMAQLAALEDYVAKRDPERLGEMQMATRRAEARIGQLLGPPINTGKPVPHAERVDRRASRHEFRRLADRFTDWWPTHARTSRRKVLDYLKRLDRQRDDRAARQITAAERRHRSGDGWVMACGDMGDVLAEMPDQSIDLIVTDPPYARETLHVWSLLAEQAARVLVPQGIVCALSGKIMLPEVIDRLREHLEYAWVYCEPLPGSTSRIVGRHVGQAWKPWLAYSNGPWPSGQIEWHPDMLDGMPMDKALFHWQQSTGPAAQLITYLCPDRGVVLDPFAGSGSYGIATLQMGRRFIGIEADTARFDMACDRLAD